MLRTNFLGTIFIPALLLITLAIGLYQAYTVGCTTDEDVHVASAYLAIERGDFRFDPEHPILFKYFTALPLLPLHLNKPQGDEELWSAAAPTFYDSWWEARTWADRFFYTSGNPTETMVFLSRIPGVLVLVGLVYALYALVLMATKRELAARLTALVAATAPTFLAHGPTTNTDIPLALATVLVLIALYRWGEAPSRPRAFFVGLALLVAVTTKFSGIILLAPAFVWAVTAFRSHKVEARQAWIQAGIVLLTVWAGIWIVYGFQSQYNPLEPKQEQETVTQIRKTLAEHGVTLKSAALTRYFLPMAFSKGLALTAGLTITGKGAYLLGVRTSHGGFAWYFPALFVLKTQFALLAALAIGVFLARKRIAKPKQWSDFTKLLVVTGVIIAIAVLRSNLNIGLRHASAILPILAIAIGFSLAALYERSRYAAMALIVLAIVPFFLQKSFDPISFANTPIDPVNQWRLYDDSNLDWGQEIKPAAEYIRATFPNEKVYCNPWHSNEAWLHYLRKPVNSYDNANPPGDGIVVLSASQRANAGYSKAFGSTEPIATIGNGITFLYKF